MEDDIIGKVVEVEKEVQEKIRIETTMTQDWLENVRKEAEKRVLAEETSLKEAAGEAINNAKLMNEKRAEEIIKEAGLLSERFEGLGDEQLKKIVLPHLSKILPGH